MFVITYAKTTEAMKVAKISDCKKYILRGEGAGIIPFWCISLTSVLMPQWTAFQLDHPMGGVRATPSLDASTLTRVSDKGTILEQEGLFKLQGC